MKVNKKKLEIAMARACMNTADIVVIAKMQRPTVNNVITGHEVRPATLGKVARALGVDITEIIEQ